MFRSDLSIVKETMFKLTHCLSALAPPSSETQGQLVAAAKRLNGEEKNSAEEKSRTLRRAPGDKVNGPVPNGRGSSDF